MESLNTSAAKAEKRKAKSEKSEKKKKKKKKKDRRDKSVPREDKKRKRDEEKAEKDKTASRTDEVELPVRKRPRTRSVEKEERAKAEAKAAAMKSTENSDDADEGKDARGNPPVTSFQISADTRERLAKRGIKHLFPIQAQTFADVFAGHDMIGRARTGQGKTLAFALPVIERILQVDYSEGGALDAVRCYLC